MMADRGISVTHTTILQWVQRYLPEFEKRWRRYDRPVGRSWGMDETYIKVHGQWVYLYRAVDKAGQTIDFFLSRNRDVNAAKSFLRSAMMNGAEKVFPMAATYVEGVADGNERIQAQIKGMLLELARK